MTKTDAPDDSPPPTANHGHLEPLHVSETNKMLLFDTVRRSSTVGTMHSHLFALFAAMGFSNECATIGFLLSCVCGRSGDYQCL